MKKINLLLLFGLLLKFGFSQNISLDWSEQMECDNKKDGFFEEFIGSNSQFVYAKFHHSSYHPSLAAKQKNEKEVKLFCFDKNNSQKKYEVQIKGNSEKTAELDYHSAYVFEDRVLVCFTKRKKNLIEVHVESFDSKLKKLQGLKKVYEVSNPNSKLADGGLIILINKSNKIFIGSEIIDKDNKELKLDYRILNPDMSMVNSKQVVLPIVVEKVKRNFNNSYWFSNYRYNYSQKKMAICSYVLASNGDVYTFADVKRKNSEENYTMINKIDSETGDLTTHDLSFKDKEIDSYRIIEKNNEMSLVGLYSLRGDKSTGINGIFINKLDKHLANKDLKFIPFDKRFVSTLFEKDKEEVEQRRNKSNKKNDLNTELSGFYFIEKIIEENGNMVIFCSKMYNYLVTECTTTSNGSSSSTSCRDVPFCEKSNVTVFNISTSGDLLWAKNLDRKATYRGYWNVLDLEVIKGKDFYNVIYGSDYQMTAEKKNRKSKKPKKQLTDRLEYASFAIVNGNFSKQEYKINQINTPKSEQKRILATNLWVFDNQIYTQSMRLKRKGTTWLGCLCPPVLMFTLNSGNFFKGYSHFGIIKSLN